MKSNSGCPLGRAVPLQGREEIRLSQQVGFDGAGRSPPSLDQKVIKAHPREGLSSPGKGLGVSQAPVEDPDPWRY